MINIKFKKLANFADSLAYMACITVLPYKWQHN